MPLGCWFDAKARKLRSTAGRALPPPGTAASTQLCRAVPLPPRFIPAPKTQADPRLLPLSRSDGAGRCRPPVPRRLGSRGDASRSAAGPPKLSQCLRAPKSPSVQLPVRRRTASRCRLSRQAPVRLSVCLCRAIRAQLRGRGAGPACKLDSPSVNYRRPYQPGFAYNKYRFNTHLLAAKIHLYVKHVSRLSYSIMPAYLIA